MAWMRMPEIGIDRKKAGLETMNGDFVFGAHTPSVRLTGTGRNDKDPWNSANGPNGRVPV
jgi:hypothetical protein